MEREWGWLMNQTFLLQYYGRISVADQMSMTSEERSWYIERIDKEHKRREEEERKALNKSS